MNRNIFMALVLLIFLACSDKEPTPKVPLKEKVDVNKTISTPTSSSEFIPEHIKKSKIEVVKHY